VASDDECASRSDAATALNSSARRAEGAARRRNALAKSQFGRSPAKMRNPKVAHGASGSAMLRGLRD